MMTAAEIQTKLNNISAAIDIVLSGGKSYSLNDGQGVMSVTRSSLKELNSAYDFWNSKLSELSSGDYVSMRSVR
jgi:hypothetical protein